MIRFLVVVLACTLAGCGKRGEAIVARLEETTAQVERMPRANAPWQPAKVGDTFIIGSGVRTGAGSKARLKVGKNGKLDVDASSVVYFSRTAAQKRGDLRVETGAAELETGEDSIAIGEAVLDPSTHARLEASPEGTKLVVTIGRAVLEDGELAAGGEAVLGPTGKRVDKSPPKDAGVALPPNGGAAITVHDKPVKVEDQAGSRELPVGEHVLPVGATVAVPDGGTIEIVRGGARGVTVGASSLRIGEGNILLQMINGAVTLRGEGAPAVATVKGGKVAAQVGGDVALMVDAKNVAIDAQRGETIVTSAKGDKTLSAGQSALLDGKGELAIAPPAPERTVVTIVAGESPTLHDPKAPTPVRVAFDQACPTTGVVEVAKDRSFKKIIARSGGAGSANVLVPAGSFSYRVRCPGAAGAAGTIKIAKDSGRNPLPAAAARTTVEMDGREYTVLYQNVLPELTLAWRNALRAKSYSFVIKPARGTEKRVVNTSPSLKLMSGELREGSYKVWVEPAGGTRSEEARVVIEFDNAAQSASIDRVEAVAGKIHVKGTVIEGSTVSAAGAGVGLDRQRRFSTDVAPGDREDGVGVRIAHPRAGIHYYVVRTVVTP